MGLLNDVRAAFYGLTGNEEKAGDLRKQAHIDRIKEDVSEKLHFRKMNHRPGAPHLDAMMAEAVLQEVDLKVAQAQRRPGGENFKAYSEEISFKGTHGQEWSRLDHKVTADVKDQLDIIKEGCTANGLKAEFLYCSGQTIITGDNVTVSSEPAKIICKFQEYTPPYANYEVA